MAKTLAIALTEAGVASARKAHPENTKRKAVSLRVRDTKQATYTVQALGGVPLTIDQVKVQFQAHWTLLRKESGSRKDPGYTGEGRFANDYSRKIVAETKAILDKAGVRKL